MTTIFTDYHNHCLPGMDDGAKDVAVSLQMLSLLKNQSIDRVVATPHYYPHREGLASFLKRREQALEQLVQKQTDMRILSGAEVALERGLETLPDLDRLTLHGSRYLLLELPYAPLKKWMLEEIHNIAVNWDIVPVIAHLDRYLIWYKTKDLAEVLAIPDSVIQLNYSALKKRKSRKLALDLIRKRYPVLFGTDAHDMVDRKPNADLIYSVLKRRLTPEDWIYMLEYNQSFL